MQASLNGFKPSLRHLSRNSQMAICGIFGLLSFTGLAPSARAQVDVLTQHNDILRTGANLSETILNTSNVKVATFGKIFSRTVDGDITGQPLYVSNVAINGGTYRVVYVATSNNNVYAFDAENPGNSTPIWQKNLGAPATAGELSLSGGGPWGVMSTPVIDAATNTIYICAATSVATTAQYILHALDITTGTEKLGGPVTIAGSVPGTGVQSVGGVLNFDPSREWARTALTIANGKVYLAFSAHEDIAPWHGWIFAYDEGTLARTAIYCTTPNDASGGIWQSGQGLAVDNSGNIYASVGNGTFNAATNAFGDSAIKLSPSLSLLDYFTPYNQANLDTTDIDLGCGGVMGIPGSTDLVLSSKSGEIYLVNSTNMGHFHAGSDNQIIQSFMAAVQEVASNWGDPPSLHSTVYWTSPHGPLVYTWADTDQLRCFLFTGGLFNTTPDSVGPSSEVVQAGSDVGLAISANGSTLGSGILWAETGTDNALRAYDASKVSTELWNSKQNTSQDGLPSNGKFASPTVANGKVYVPTDSNQLVVYGLLSAPTDVRAAAGDKIVALSWQGSSSTTGYNVNRSTVSGGPYTTINTSPITNYDTGTQTIGDYVDTNVVAGTTYYYQVTAIVGATEVPAPEVSATPVDNSSIQANIVQAPIAPIIDGNPNDAVWATATSYDLKNVFLQVPASPAIYSASFKAAWDATNLYVLFDVTDPVKVNDSINPWDDDAVELYVDSTNSKGSSYNSGDFELVFGYGDTTVWEQTGHPAAGIVFKQTDKTTTPGGYFMEISIPWSSLNVTPSQGYQIGFDAASTNDDDGGPRETRIAWKDPTNDDWDKPSVFGTGVLSGVSSQLASITVVPGSALVDTGSQVQFVATANDASGTPLPTQPPFTWTVSGGGTIDPLTGLFTAGSVGGGPFTVTATSGTVHGTAQVNVNDPNFAYPVPAISSLSPSSTSNKGPSFTLTVNGVGFVGPSVVQWNGAALTTTFISPTQLSAVVPAANIAQSGVANITVFTPVPGGGTSTPLIFSINSTLLNSFSAGLILFSVPEDMSNVPLSTALGLASPKLAVWDPTAFSYAMTPTAPADVIRLGRAYWARFPSTVQLFDVGTKASQSVPFSIALQAGWNMIGDPFPNSVLMSNLIVEDDQQFPYNLTDGNKVGLIYPTFYSYDPAVNKYVNHTQTTSDTIDPYIGYWVYAFKSCTLRVAAHGSAQ